MQLDKKRFKEIHKKVVQWEKENRHIPYDEQLRKMSKDLKIPKKELVEYCFRKLQRSFRVRIHNVLHEFQQSFFQFENFFLGK